MKKPLILILLSFFILSACKKEKVKGPYIPVARCVDFTRNMDTINIYIQGNWEWVEEFRVTRYEGEQYITPHSPGSNHLRLKLSGDTARFFVNNRPDSVFRFRIQWLFEFTNYPTDSLPVLVYYSFYTGQRQWSQVPIMICKNQLLMQHQYVSSIVGENLWLRK